MHEAGHYCAARILGLQVEKVMFSFRPFPRVYISVLEKGVTHLKRIAYLLSGNAVTWVVFVLLNFIHFKGMPYFLVIAVIQILAETNPFLSDYSSLVFWAANRKALAKIPPYICHKEQEEEIQKYLREIQDGYFLSPAWLVHFTVWAVFLVVMLRMYVISE